jgi:hypothetical protein
MAVLLVWTTLGCFVSDLVCGTPWQEASKILFMTPSHLSFCHLPLSCVYPLFLKLRHKFDIRLPVRLETQADPVRAS